MNSATNVSTAIYQNYSARFLRIMNPYVLYYIIFCVSSSQLMSPDSKPAVVFTAVDYSLISSPLL